MTQSHIYVVDDDEHIGQLIKAYLEKEGYLVTHFLEGASCLRAFEKTQPSLMILDIMLPGMNGWDICREVRRKSQLPIIMLSAKGETFDKVLGLELGADDYVVKPFDPKELVARVKAVLRRTRMADCEDPDDVVEHDALTVNLTDYTVTAGGSHIDMPPKELELLYFLAAHPNKVFTREQLLEQVWGFDFFGDTRTVDVHIKRLREKLYDISSQWEIKTVWGVGYKFEVK